MCDLIWKRKHHPCFVKSLLASLIAASKSRYMLPSFMSLKVPLNSRCSPKSRKITLLQEHLNFRGNLKVQRKRCIWKWTWPTQVFVFRTHQGCPWYILANVNKAFGQKKWKVIQAPLQSNSLRIEYLEWGRAGLSSKELISSRLARPSNDRFVRRAYLSTIHTMSSLSTTTDQLLRWTLEETSKFGVAALCHCLADWHQAPAHGEWW